MSRIVVISIVAGKLTARCDEKLSRLVWELALGGVSAHS